MSVTGTCMEPHYPDGCHVKVTKLEPYAHGDVVIVWFRPEIIKPGGGAGDHQAAGDDAAAVGEEVPLQGSSSE